MFTATLNGKTFQDMLTPLDALVDECKLRFDDTGVVARAVDPANVGMVDFHLEAGAFETFNADEGVIGVNLSRLGEIAAMASSDSLVALELDEETRKLNISFDGLSFTVSLIDPDSIRKEPDIPELDLAAVVFMEGSQFDRAMKAADMVSDHVQLRASEQDNAFFIEAEGDTDDVELELSADDLLDLQAADAQSLFSLDYLKDINTALPSDAEVELNIGEEFPLKMFYDLAEGTGHVTFMLAPRIQSD